MPDQPPVLPPDARELEELARRDIAELRAAAQEFEDSTEACDTPALERFRRRREARARALREAAERIARLLAAATQGAEALGYATRLFQSVAPQCTPEPDVLGLLIQLDNAFAGERDARTTAERERAALIGVLRERACQGVNPDRRHDEPVRFGELLPECAGGLAYFSCGHESFGPARTFEEAIAKACEAFAARAASPIPETPADARSTSEEASR